LRFGPRNCGPIRFQHVNQAARLQRRPAPAFGHRARGADCADWSPTRRRSYFRRRGPALRLQRALPTL